MTFIHTTWDRFVAARELNDLFAEGDEFVDRLHATLKERGIQAERQYEIREQASGYAVPLVVPSRDGRIELQRDKILRNDAQMMVLADQITREVAQKGAAKGAPEDDEYASEE